MRRTAVGLLITGACALTAAFLPPPGPSVAVETTTPEPVTVTVDGTSDIMLAQFTPWFDAFSETLTTVEYQAIRSAAARENLMAGQVDAAIVGSPYTEDERKASKVGDTIEVPIHVSAAALLMTEPQQGNPGFEELEITSPEEDPDCDPQSADFVIDDCVVRTPYTGPIRIPHGNLAAMILGVDFEGRRAWEHPDIRAAFGAPNLTLAGGPSSAPSFVHRQPGESVNRHLQQYIVTAAPDVWALGTLADSEAPFVVGERMSVPNPTTRSTPSGQAQTVADFTKDAKSGSGQTPGWGGNMTAVPPAAIAEAKETFKVTAPPFRVVEVKNGADQWVEPTSDSISKAVAAGGAKPLYALENPVEGAYPLVWVDQLSVPAKGLSPEKVNALASLVRHIASQGQEGAAALGEGRLSPALVTEALRGADAIVRSNCSGDGVRAASVTDPGPYAPKALADAGIGEMLLCERTTPAEQPIAEPDISPEPPAADEAEEVFDAGPELALPSASNEQPEADAPEPAETAQPVEARPKAAPKAKLPYAVLAALPGGVDRVTTIFMGAVLFLLGRATLWPRIRKRLG